MKRATIKAPAPAAPLVPPSPPLSMDLIDDIDGSWHDVNDLMLMIDAIGNIAHSPESSDADALLLGLSAVARIVREKVETMHAHATEVWKAYRDISATGGAR